MTYDLSAGTENFTFQCFTKNGNSPQVSPNAVTLSNEVTETTLTPHNGQIKASVSLSPQVGDASCQGKGLKLCLTAVDYEDVIFEDVTNDLSVSMPNIIESNLEICGF